MTYDFHRYANIFPLMEGEAFERLAADILDNGLIEPVVLYDGAILDGRNRYRACQHVGVPARFVEYDGDNPLGFVISKNRHRRHLTSSQLAAIAVQQEELMTELAAEARARKLSTLKQMSAGGAPVTETFPERANGEARERVADIFGTNPRYIDDAKRLKEAAPDLLQQVAIGELTIPEAKREHQHRERQERRAERNDRDTRLYQEHAPINDVSVMRERFMLHIGDMANICAELEQGSIDVIITDPPYPKEFLGVYESLAQAAARVLKPGGSLIAMTGQFHLPDVLALMTPHLRYHWTLAYLTPGGQSPQIFPRKVNTFWKPLLWFVKGDYTGDWHGDVLRSDPNDNDKRFHYWGQSESGIARIVETFSLPGETVLDPFCGGGTTGIVALELGRRFVGIDIDSQAIDTTQQRLIDAIERLA